MNFEELGLIAPLVRAVAAEGYTTPTPIQEQAIPHAIAGRDILGSAQTGTGKTAAFALPILQRLYAEHATTQKRRVIRALILTPTRELAAQIQVSFQTYGKFMNLQSAVIFGGVGQRPQEDALRRGIDVLVATPGRLLDLMQQRLVDFSGVEVFVLDEADRMLDMGFIHDVKRVIEKLPKKRQTLFFSATMPPDIARLADAILTDPAKVAVAAVSQVAERITQQLYFVEQADKKTLLVHLLQDKAITRILVFTRTKHGANRLTEQLGKSGIHAEAIHGNKSQGARERALAGFKRGTVRALVATDIAARGIDIDDLMYVVNFDLPEVPETYVHRIGRTARAGASGTAFAFCARDERDLLVDIERLMKLHIPVVDSHPSKSATAAPEPTSLEGRSRPPRTQPARQQQRQQRPQHSRPSHSGPRPAAHTARDAGAGHNPYGGGAPRAPGHAPSRSSSGGPSRGGRGGRGGPRV